MNAIALFEKKYCQDSRIHPVCLRCKSACKTGYTAWSWCMPGTEYCAHFEEHPFWTTVSNAFDFIEERSQKIEPPALKFYRELEERETQSLATR